MKKNNKGFTLVELIVVLVILAILAAILVPTLLGYIDRARSEKDFSTAQTVRVAAQAAIDQAYGNGELASGAAVAAGKTLTIDGTGTNAVAMSENAFAGSASVSGTTTTYTGGKYAEMVYKLSGVDASKVSAFTFKYTNGIIESGNVTINEHIYYLSNGSWSTTAPTTT